MHIVSRIRLQDYVKYEVWKATDSADCFVIKGKPGFTVNSKAVIFWILARAYFPRAFIIVKPCLKHNLFCSNL